MSLTYNSGMASNIRPVSKPQKVRHFIKEWRKYRGFTQERLAERLDISASSISQLETGKMGYTQSMLEGMADALDCEPAALLGVNPSVAGEVIDLVALLRRADPDRQQQAIAVVRTLLGAGTGGGPAIPSPDEARSAQE